MAVQNVFPGTSDDNIKKRVGRWLTEAKDKIKEKMVDIHEKMSEEVYSEFD